MTSLASTAGRGADRTRTRPNQIYLFPEHVSIVINDDYTRYVHLFLTFISVAFRQM